MCNLTRIVLFGCLIVALSARADVVPVVINVDAQSIDLSAATYLLEDPDGKLTLQDVQSPVNTSRFEITSVKRFSTSAYWLRINLASAASRPSTWWLDSGNHIAQAIDFFAPDENGIYQRLSAGSAKPFADRPLPLANFVFPIVLPSDRAVEIFVRIRSFGFFPQNSFHHSQLWQPSAYEERASDEKTQWFFYIGMATVLCLFNLMLYFAIRDVNYIFYVLSLLSIVWFISSAGGGVGWAYKYFWPNFPVFEQTAWSASVLAYTVFPTVFLWRMIDFRHEMPRTYRFAGLLLVLITVFMFIRVVVTAMQLTTLSWLFNGAFIVGNSLGLILSTTIIYVMVAIARSGNRTAIFVVVASFPLIFAAFFSGLSSLSGQGGALRTIMWASAFELVMMSLVLADRLNQERNAKQKAQDALVEGLQQSERELEGKVADRTAEIAELNRTLEQRVDEQVDQIGRLGKLKRFFSPQLAEVIVAGGEEALKTHRREVSVVFIDLRGFTAFTDRAEPEEVMEMLCAFHATMGRIVMEHNGTLERFAGDSVMVFLNDPVPMKNHAEQAVLMALEMQAAFVTLEEKWQQRGFNLGLGCGIALGYATLGEIGFEGRWDYAAIGSVTNLAARLCAEAASGEVLVDQKMMDKVRGMVSAAEKGSLTIKGFAQPVAAYFLTGLKP